MRLLLPAVAAIVLTVVAAISMARGDGRPIGTIVVKAAWARATPPGASVGAAYVTLQNDGGNDERLISAASPAARTVELHATTVENDVAAMRPIGEATIPAGGTLEMRPGGTHLMLTGLAEPMTVGDTLPLTLVFENAGTVMLALDVAPIGAGAPAASHDHDL